MFIMFKCCFILSDAFPSQRNQNVKKKKTQKNLTIMLAEISPWGPQNDMTITSNFFMVYNVLATSYSFYSSQSAIEIMN